MKELLSRVRQGLQALPLVRVRRFFRVRNRLVARLHHLVHLVKGFMPLVPPAARASGRLFAVPRNRCLGFRPAGQARWFD